MVVRVVLIVPVVPVGIVRLPVHVVVMRAVTLRIVRVVRCGGVHRVRAGAGVEAFLLAGRTRVGVRQGRGGVDRGRVRVVAVRVVAVRVPVGIADGRDPGQRAARG